MGVLQNHEHWPPGGKHLELTQQDLERAVFAALWREVKRSMQRVKRDRQKWGKHQDGFPQILCCGRKQGLELCKFLIGAILTPQIGGARQLANHGIECAVLVKGRTLVDQSSMSVRGQPLLKRKRQA